MPLAAGTRLGPYEIVAVVGAGGMGDVYRAHDTRLHRTVAIKVLPPDRFRSTDGEQRFLQEARAASALNHPNIVTIHDIARERPIPARGSTAPGAAESAGTPGEPPGEISFLVMEYVPGESLARAIPPNGMTSSDLLDYATQMASALAVAHKAGIVHRDIKPANVIVTPERQVKILDFGLAKLPQARAAPDDETRAVGPDLTEPGKVLGTVSYMSPEQARGEPVDARTDLFSLGAVMYEMATGHRAFFRPFDWTTPEPPRSQPEINRLIFKLLETDRDRRYQAAADVLADLGRLHAAPTLAVSKRGRLWATVLIVVVAVAAMAGLAWRGFRSPAGPSRLSDGNRASPSREANEYYEKALLFGGGGIEDNGQQTRLLERALALDAKFAAARAEYAFSHVVRVLSGSSADPALLYQTEAQARQALRDDPECGRAHSVLALTFLMQGRKELAPPEIDRALQLNPDDVTAYTWRLEYHHMNGDHDQAATIARDLIHRWPLYWPGHLYLSMLLNEQGDTAGAIREAEAALEQDPRNTSVLVSLARAYADSADVRKARETLGRIRIEDRQNLSVRLLNALILALEGRRSEADREMDERTQAYAALAPQHVLDGAEFYAVIGRATTALQWLDRAVRAGDDREAFVRRDPHLMSLRTLPEFQKIVDSVAYRRAQRAQTGARR